MTLSGQPRCSPRSNAPVEPLAPNRRSPARRSSPRTGRRALRAVAAAVKWVRLPKLDTRSAAGPGCAAASPGRGRTWPAAWRCQVRAPPVAADEGVCLVPEPDRLQVLDAHDLAELPGADDLLHRARVRHVAHQWPTASITPALSTAATIRRHLPRPAPSAFPAGGDSRARRTPRRARRASGPACRSGPRRRAGHGRPAPSSRRGVRIGDAVLGGEAGRRTSRGSATATTVARSGWRAPTGHNPGPLTRPMTITETGAMEDLSLEGDHMPSVARVVVSVF